MNNNILDLIQKESGIISRKKASTRGGEYSSACPFCNDGVDRFSILPAEGRFVCRRCRKSGDSIEFIKLYLNKNYYEACEYLGIQSNYKPSYSLDTASDKSGYNPIRWEPRKIVLPPDLWQSKAQVILFESFKYLLSASGKKQRSYLNNRGISNEVIKKNRIGYNPRNLSFDAGAFGIVSDDSKNVSMANVWLPRGILLPHWINQKLVGLRIRRDEPDVDNRFILVRGSCMVPIDHSTGIKNKPWAVVESFLDGCLLFDIAGDIIQVFSLGSAQEKPNATMHSQIKDTPGLICLDNDQAGIQASAWWLKQYPLSLTWPSVHKDIGDDFTAGLDLRQWIIEGLTKLKQKNPGVKNDLMKKEKSIFNINLHKVFQESYKTKKPKITPSPAASSPPPATKKYTKKAPQERQCVHNLCCRSLKNNTCLVDKSKPFETLSCPKGTWWISKMSQNISQIILGPGVKKYA